MRDMSDAWLNRVACAGGSAGRLSAAVAAALRHCGVDLEIRWLLTVTHPAGIGSRRRPRRCAPHAILESASDAFG